MNAYYFKEQIHEELHGAKDYIKRAIEIRPMSPAWAKNFAEMSTEELAHATGLVSMFQEYYNKISGAYDKVPDYIEDMYKETMDEYAECSSKVKYMHEMFKQ